MLQLIIEAKICFIMFPSLLSFQCYCKVMHIHNSYPFYLSSFFTVFVQFFVALVSSCVSVSVFTLRGNFDPS